MKRLAFVAALFVPFFSGFAAPPTFEAPATIDLNFSANPGALIGTAPGLNGGKRLDFNGNATFEVVANQNSALNFYPGTSNSLVPPANATSVAVGDFNADAKPDLAVVAGGDLLVYLNTSTGTAQTFAAPVTFSGSGFTQVAAGDLDGDGDLDLVAASPLVTTGPQVIPFLNGGSAASYAFTQGTATDLSLSGVSTIAAGDLTGDAAAEVVVAFERSAQRFSFSGGVLTVQGGTTILGYVSTRLFLADVSGDGKNDLVSFGHDSTQNNANEYTNSTGVDIARNTSGEDNGAGGTFATGTLEPVAFGSAFTAITAAPSAASLPVDGALGDLNGDGRLEVIGTLQNAAGTSGQLIIQQFKESTTSGAPLLVLDYLAPATTVQFASAYPRRVAVTDLDSDDKLDLVIALMNDDTFQPSLVKATNTTGTGGGGGGGDLEIVVTSPATGSVGETLSFTIALRNNRTTAYNNIRLHAWLPADSTRVMATPPRGVLTETGGRSGFDWAITKLEPNSETVRILAVKANVPTTFTPGDKVARVYAVDAAGTVLATADLATTQVTTGGSFSYGSEIIRVAANGKTGQTFGRQFERWKFDLDHPNDATLPGLAVKLQYAPYPATVWTDLPGGDMTRRKPTATTWSRELPMPLASGFYQFRTISTATGKVASPGPATTPCFVEGVAKLDVAVVTECTDDPSGILVRPGNDITYRITVTNIGSETAPNVAVYGPVPGGTSFAAAATANGGTILPVQISNNRGVVTSVVWNVPLLTPGQSVTVNYTVETGEEAKLGSKVSGAGWAAVYNVTPVTNLPTFLAAVVSGVKNKTASVGNVPSSLVVAGLSLNIQASTGVAPVGSIINYTATAQNLYKSARPECVVTIRIPAGMAFESFGSANGSNFNGNAVNVISTVTNPSLVRPDFLTPGVLTWNLGTLAGRATRQLTFSLRVGADLPDTVANPAGGTSPNEVAISEYNFRTGGGRTPFYLFDRPTLKDTAPVDAKSLTQPKVRTLLTVPTLSGLPQLGGSKQVIGENGGFLSEEGVEVPTVTPDGGFFTEITVTNRGGVTARNCRVVEAIAPNVVFDTSVTIDNAPVAHGSYRTFDSTNAEITPANVAADGRRFFQTAVVMFQLGDLAANQTKVVRYRTRAATVASRIVTKPVKDPTPLKAGVLFPNLAPSIFSDSFALPIPVLNTPPASRVVTPVSLAVEMYPSQPSALAGDSFSFDTVIRNNGGATATGLSFSAPIPAGTTYTGAQFVDSLTSAVVGTPTVTLKPTRGETKSIAFPITNVPGDSSLIVRVNLTLKPGAQLPASFAKPGSQVAFDGTVTYKPASGTSFRTRSESSASIPGPATTPALTSSFLKYLGDPTGPRLCVLRQCKLSVREGDTLVYTITVGNHGGTAIPGASVAMLIPATADLVSAGAAGSFKRAGAKITWDLGTLAPHSGTSRSLVVRPKVGVTRKDNLIVENSCVATGSNVGDVAPGACSTLVLNTNPIAGAWQSFTAYLGGFGARGVATKNNALAQRVARITDATIVTSVGGADLIANDGGSVIIPLGGGNVIAAGPASIVAAGAGNIIAGGAGNIVAAGAGNIVAAGAGNLIANDGASLTSANISQLALNIRAELVAGSIVAAGAGNLLANDGASLLANDGASVVGNLSAGGTIVAAGAGNLIATGGSNVVAAGGGNIVAAGGGNIVAGGAGNLKPNPGSAAQAIHVSANGGNIVAGGAGNIVAGGAGNIVAGGAGNTVAGGAGNIVAGGAGN